MDLSCQINPGNSTYSVRLLVLEVVTGVMCVFSITGCLLIITSFCMYKDLRTRARLVVVLLAFSVLCYTTANLVGIVVTHLQKSLSYANNSLLSTPATNSTVLDTLCKVQAGIAVFFYIAAIFWTYCIAFYILMSVLQSKVMSNITFYFFLIVSWLVPVVILVYLIVYDYLGYSCLHVNKTNSTSLTEVDVSSLWCTIAYSKVYSKDSRILINVLAFDVWLFMGYLILPIIFVLVKLAMKKQASRLSTLYEQCLKSSREIDVKLLLIPLAFILINVWSTVRDILFLMQRKNDYYWLVLLQSVGDCSQGLVIFVIYFLMTKYVRQAMRKKCSCRKQPNEYKTIKASPIKKSWWKIPRSEVLKDVSTVN